MTLVSIFEEMVKNAIEVIIWKHIEGSAGVCNQVFNRWLVLEISYNEIVQWKLPVTIT
jgi:hypothetical protein